MIQLNPGRKDDTGKPRFSLLRFGMPRALQGVAAVLTFGAKKYADHSWQSVDNNLDRYWSAMERHMNAIASGEVYDDESGLRHIDHVACNAMFLAEIQRGFPLKPHPPSDHPVHDELDDLDFDTE